MQLAFWLIPPSGLMLVASYFVDGAAQAGWTAYPPLSITTPQSGQIILDSECSITWRQFYIWWNQLYSDYYQIKKARIKTYAIANVLLGNAWDKSISCIVNSCFSRHFNSSQLRYHR